MKEFTEMVIRLIKQGVNPNILQKHFHDAIQASNKEWKFWEEDNFWRKDKVCSMCGSEYPGMCGHQNSKDQKVILRSAYRSM